MSVCVGPGQKPHCWFSHEAAHLYLNLVSGRMYRPTALTLCFLWFTLCGTAPTRDKRMSWIPQTTTITENDNTVTAAEKILLTNSHFLLKLPNAVIYEKEGRYHDAVSEFYALGPINVRHPNEKTQIEIHGKVGKQLVILTAGKRIKNGDDTFPQISITSLKLGNDSKYSFKMKVFWYLGAIKMNRIEV